MTGDVDVRREASVEVLSLNGKIDDKCGADVRAQQDLVKSVGDCNGVSHREEEETINNGIENGNGNGKDDADGTYVFVKGSEAVGEGVGNSLVGTNQREESSEGKASDIDVGMSKVSAGNGNCDVEQAAVNRENGDGEGKLVNGEIGDHLFDEHIVVNKVEIAEQEGNAVRIKENNEETVVDEAETDAGHGKAIDLNDVECHVEDHLLDNHTGVADSQGEYIESTLAGSTSADEQNCEADIVVSTHSKQHEGEFHTEKQPAAESSLVVTNEFAGSCDATVAAFKCNNTFEAPRADEVDSSGQMGVDQKSSLEVEPSLEPSEEFSGSCDVIVVESECERASEIPQTDQGDFSGQVDKDQKSELKIEDSGKGEVLKIDDGAGNEDEKVVEDRKSCPDIETEQNYEPERISEVPQADQVDSSGQVDKDQKSELKIEDSGEGEVLKIDDGNGIKGEKVMEERKSCPDKEAEQNHEPDRTFEVPQANQVDSSGQVDEHQKSELEIEDSGEGVVLKINDGAGKEDEKVSEEIKSCPDKETEESHEPERTSEVSMADQADSSGKVDEGQESELTIVDSGQGEVSKVDDGFGNEDEKVMEESISCPDEDKEQNPEPEVILTKGLVSGKENPSTRMGDDYSSEAAPEDISMNSNKIATADTRAGPFSDDTGDIEPTATAPDPIASEIVEHEAVTDALDTSQEINEEACSPENTESTPSSVSCGNVPVQIELEEVNAEKIQTSIPQCVDANLEVREENDSTVVDVTSSCSATNLSPITEICFGSISQKEISSIPSDDIAEPKVSNSLSQSARSYDIHTTECPSNDTAENESFSAQDSKLGLKNELDAVLDEKREDQSTIENDKPAFSQAEGDDLVAQNAALAEVSSIPASEEQNVGSEVEKKLFNVLVKIPRYDDENTKLQINEAQSQVTEKTQSRDAIQAEIQIIKAVCKEHSDKIEVALSEENAARELLKSKREEIDAVQSVINKVKSAIAVGDYDVKIQNMEQKIQHETLPLKEEKQLVRDIKLLKLSREQLSNDMGGPDELKVALDQREQTEERLKSLRREADLLRENVLKAEAVTKSAKRKYSDERDKLRELQGWFRDADKIRQEAYIHLKNLRKQSYEKNKYFWKYKDDVKMSIDLASKGNREALSRFCIDQVETFMELWNRSNDFREEYLRCNASRTLRRLGTADGRSLGPNEAMPAIHTAVNQTAIKDKSMSALPSIEQEKVSVVMEARPAADDKLPMKEVEQKKEKAKNKNSAKAVAQVEDLVTVVSRDVVNVEMEEPKLSKEEEELAKKAEELRKAEEAAMLMEQRRLEEKAKAKEALERKKRNAERALARAASKAQKEAEQKEKEREKKAKKKERKKAGGTIATPSDAGIEGESASSSEATADTPADFDTKDKPAAMVKRPQKPSYFVKQTKVKPIPPTLRNKGKRKMQPWMWAVLTVLLVFALFLVSNGGNLF